MRKLLVVLSLLLAPSLFAQTADLEITSLTVSNAPARTGERFAMALRWRNNGPDPARFITLTVSGNPSPYYVLNVATSGWPCYPNADGTSFTCQNAEMVLGAEAELVLQMISPPVAGNFTLHANVQSHTADPNPANNTRDFSATLEPSPSADLSLSPTSQTQRANAGEAVTVPVIVRNTGNNPVDNLILYFSVPVSSAPPPFTIQGDGWSCGHLAYGPQAYVCTRPRLNGGEVAPVTVSTHALASGSFTISGRVRGENHSDPSLANDTTTILVQTGVDTTPQQTWSRMLIPLIGPDVPGANGSLWRTEVTALITGDRQVDVRPLFCEFVTVCDVPVWPLNVPFNAFQQGLAGQVLPSAIGQFVYVPAADAARLHVNARVYDVSRAAETAGAEIPIAREDDFTNARVSLVGIPVAREYRHTLRVYDLGGTTADVRISVYANNETVPRASIVRALTAPAQGFHTTNLSLPVHPGVIQLDLGAIAPTAGATTLRVDIEPVDPSTRLWSFVSLTNNATHHVTTFSQH